MKKSIVAIIILVIGASAIGLPASAYSMTQTYEEEIMFCTNLANEWTGMVRIEGENDTIWKGTVAFSSSLITAENMETHEMETHEIPYPSVLGVLDEASKQGGFSYTVLYYPSWDSFYVMAIGADSADEKTGWVYWVDYEAIMVGADTYELTGDDDEILWGYLYFETWETSAHALQITLDTDAVKKNEKFTVSVYNESMSPVDGAVVYIDSMTFTTDENGKANASIDTVGTYEIYAEKDPTADDTYVRSDGELLNVEKSKGRPLVNLFEHFPILEKLLCLSIFEKLSNLQ
jgi:uncharacterized protein DUF4430